MGKTGKVLNTFKKKVFFFEFMGDVGYLCRWNW
mgnify:CR=1 FL=1